MIQKRNQSNSKAERRSLAVESLEPKDLLTTAGINVVPVGGGPDIRVETIGDGGKDKLSAWSIGIGSENQGNVLVLAEIDQANDDGKFDGNPDFTIARVFNVPTLQANAASLGGQFLGFNFQGLGGDDEIKLTGLKNLENTSLEGGDGKDTLIGGTRSRDAFEGGGGDDVVKDVDAFDVANTISGGDGKDSLTFFGNNGVNFINNDFENVTGTSKNDTIDSSMNGAELTINGADGNDTLIGGTNKDTLLGGRGDDTLSGGDADDLLKGEAGNDTLNGDAGNDTLEGGDNASDKKDTLNGGDGNDTLKGQGGPDALNGNAGNDKLEGGDADDILTGGEGNDELKGGDGSDTANYSDAPAGVNINMPDKKAEPDGYGNKDTFDSIENATGSEFDDVILGDSGNNVLKGLGGNDDIRGNDGDDTIEGGGGDDLLVGDQFITFQAGNDTIKGGGGEDQIFGWNGNDVLEGGDGDDVIRGGFGNDALLGDMGADILNGGAGNDYLDGGFNELVTDKLFFDYDKGVDQINDVALVGGFAFRDEFIALVDVDTDLVDGGDNDGLPKNQTYGSSKDGGSLTLFERLDISDELNNEPFFSDASGNLVFTDFDGGDGADGDVLSFLGSQLP